MQPYANKHLVFMIDDIHMCHKDKWGHMSNNELMRQWLNYNGWYQTKQLNFRKIKDINFAATVVLRPGKEAVDERLGWRLATVGFINFKGCHIEQIYSHLMQQSMIHVTDKHVQQNSP